MSLKLPRSSLSPAVFVGLFVLIAATAGQGIPGGDAGELAVAACTRSVAHAPGYPLWTLLSKVALLLPFGTPTWRLALASAAATAGAAALLVAILRRAGVNGAAAVFGAAVFVCAAPVWQFATTPEVFALNSLLVAAGLYAAQRMWPLLVGLALGLGLANHLTCLALLGPIALYVMIVKRSPLVVLGAALGLVPYLYLPWASAAGSPYSWGDQTTLAGLIDHVLRRDYGTFQLMQSGNASPYVDKLLLYARSEIVPLVVGLIGAVVVARRRPPHILLLAIVGAFALAYVLLFHAAANVTLDMATHREVLSRFWIMPALVLGLFAGFAAAWVPNRLIPVALTSVLLFLGARANDRREESLVARYARAALTTMPPNTLALVRGDLSFPLIYLQACEGQRPDVWILNRPFLEFPWSRSRYLAAFPGLELPEGLYDPFPTGFPGTYALTDLMQLNIDRRPILFQYFDAMLLEYKQVAQWAGRFEILPVGFLMQAFRTSPRDWPAYATISRGALDLYAGAKKARGDAWDDLVQQEYVDAEFLRGAYLAVAAHADPQVIPVALRALDEAKNVPDQRLDRIFKVRGWALAVAAQTDPGARAEALANWREYLRLAPPTDEERARIEATVAMLEGLKP